jgi:hypothetical protein
MLGQVAFAFGNVLHQVGGMTDRSYNPIGDQGDEDNDNEGDGIGDDADE